MGRFPHIQLGDFMKTIFSTITFALIILTTNGPLFAQNNPGKSEFGIPAQSMAFKEYEQQGQLFTLKVIPSKKETRIYIVGNEAAKVSVNNYTVHALVMMGRHRQEINFKQQKDYFATKEKIKGEQLHVKLQNKESKEIEEFKIELKKP
jgi:hypothetical protein